MAVVAILYLALCTLVAYFGRDRKFGFWGYLVASLLLTPVMGALLVLGSDKRPAMRDANRVDGAKG